MMPVYEIRAGKHSPCELVSVPFPGAEPRLVWEDTRTGCVRIRDMILEHLKGTLQ